MLPLHAEAGTFGLTQSASLLVFALAVGVVGVLAYDAYRRRGEWME